MINNLNRIKRILSAKHGTEIPKFLKGYTIYHKSNNLPIYSPDGNSWFTDKNYSAPFTGNINDYTEPELKLLFHAKNSNVTIPGLNNTTLSNILSSNIVSSALNNIQSTQNYNEPYDLISNPVVGINGVTNLANNLGLSVSGENENINDPTSEIKSVANTNYHVQELIEQRKNNEVTSENIELLPRKSIDKIVTDSIKTDTYKPTYREVKPIFSEINDPEAEAYNTKQQQKYSNIVNTGAAVLQTVGDVFGSVQSTTDSDLTKRITGVYDGLSGAISNLGPQGQMIGLGLNALKGLGDIAQAAGMGTDQMSKTDSWMDSPLLSWNVGMINGIFGKNSDSFGVDQSTMAAVGSSYGGTANSINEAAKSADKKYGLFSGKARREANADIAKARLYQNKMSNIADNASDQRLAVQSMGEQAGLAYSMMIDGGYNQKYTYAAKEGGVLDWNPNISLEWEPQIELNLELTKFKEGGSVEFSEELNWVPTLQKGNTVRTIEELIEYAKKENPRFIQRLSEEPRGIKFVNDEGNEVEGSHYIESMGEYVVPRIQEINGKLKFLSKEDAINRAIETGNYLKMNPEEAIIFAEQYKQGWPKFFKKFKKGGSLDNIPEIEETTQKNVIPEGALHKNKHHMEHAEGLTKKGIPVIDEEGEQQAEIEHSEIIFTLEVTKKLEEYYQIFYSEESTNKEKEQAALDAGKLLVYQILENTEDRTGLIDSCKQGGTLTLKKSTDDLIEELFDWEPTVVIVEEKEVKKQPKNKSDKELIKEAIKEAIIELLIK